MKQKLWIVLLFAAFWSCETEEKPVTQQRVTFTLGGNHTLAKTRDASLHSVIVTIADDDGNAVVTRQELLLHSFGTGYVSEPVVFPVTVSSTEFNLTEFFVLNDSLDVIYVTPIEGSDLAHLVEDPLAIEFTVLQDQTTTVTPEVIEVNPTSDPQAYGYANFGFHVVPTHDVSFFGFIGGEGEYTDFHLKVEGLGEKVSGDSVSWTYETDIDFRSLPIRFRNAPAYRVTATKPGYATWQEVSSMNGPEYIIHFQADSIHEVDIYVGGRVKVNNDYFATYWKNDEPHRVDNDPSSIYAMTVVNDQVFAIGSDKTQENKAFYWHNDQQIMLPHAGTARTSGIAVLNNNIYVSGYLFEYRNGSETPSYTTPVYWKNGEMITLSLPEGEYKWGYTTGISVDNGQVYIAGSKRKEINPGTILLSTPVTWKNGTLIDLPVRPGPTTIYAYGMAMDNGHTYTLEKSESASDESSHYGYWTDMVWKDLDITLMASIFMIPASQPVAENGDFYFLPYTGVNRYFKNSIEVRPSGKIRELYGLDVVNGVVYVSGQYREQTGPYTGCYWVDGERHDLKQNDMAWCIVAQKRI